MAEFITAVVNGGVVAAVVAVVAVVVVVSPFLNFYSGDVSVRPHCGADWEAGTPYRSQLPRKKRESYVINISFIFQPRPPSHFRFFEKN